MTSSTSNSLPFYQRHIGPTDVEQKKMLQSLGLNSCQELLDQALPDAIRLRHSLDLPSEGLAEEAFLLHAQEVSKKNHVFKTYIGQGYYDTHLPSVIRRCILENPNWYTAYTPYQAEISQGRMEALLNFQTMVSDLTGLPIANASLLDEGTAAAEAMAMCLAINKHKKSKIFLVDQDVFPQTIEVMKTRAEPLGIEIKIISAQEKSSRDYLTNLTDEAFGLYIQYPSFSGQLHDLTDLCKEAHKKNILVTVGTDLLALALFKPPGEMGADIAVGSSQRFGVPLNFGGPHAAFMATKKEYIRSLPGRIIGLSHDVDGASALRLTLQTREQHIRREKATSNICTAQVLLAVLSSMYAVYHGPQGLKRIASRVHQLAQITAKKLSELSFEISPTHFFDTFRVFVSDSQKKEITQKMGAQKINLNVNRDQSISISFDETKTFQDVKELIHIFSEFSPASISPVTKMEIKRSLTAPSLPHSSDPSKSENLTYLLRQSSFLTHPTFNSFNTETEMLRYIRRLEGKDLTLAQSMIPLGSCTMKLNAASEMLPITWPELSQIHPFAPLHQAEGYMQIIAELGHWLCQLTGFQAVSFQPNAGSQGELTGLLVIRKYLQSIHQEQRNICLIPKSAHGTNPASAIMAGFQVVVVDCDTKGNIDFQDLRQKVEYHHQRLAALMVTYPSTHGVFEEKITPICELIHSHGGQVYMDGANFNALVGISLPQEIGADVCHLNLHKTFCIPHGGGGPGVGPIAVATHLVPFLPQHSQQPTCGPTTGIHAVASAPWGSAAILPISWAYVLMMGLDGLKKATEVAILSANYIAHRLKPYYPVVYEGTQGRVAHECIINCNEFRETAQIQVEDIAKRLMDYGFHAPTMSWPVPGTLMIEPTESESLTELDRFCEAMIQIRKEIQNIETGKADRENNVLRHAPHSASHLMASHWPHPYSREEAGFPSTWVKNRKFWPPVRRVDNAYGDRNLVCNCPSPSQFNEEMEMKL